MNNSSQLDTSDKNFDAGKLGSLPSKFLIAGFAALILSLILGRSNPTQFAFSWLFAFVYFFTICAGSLFWILLHHATDSDWSVIVRRILENLAALFPYLLILFIPLAVSAPRIYEWMNYETLSHADKVILGNKAAYLNKTFFYSRAAFYFFFFITVSLLMRKFSTEQDVNGNPLLTLRMRKLSYGCILIFAMSLTFFAFDWLMGLNFRWYSTMWGVYIFAGSALNSMAMLILISNGLKSRGYLKHMTVEHNHIMGKLLFSFIVFWAYIGFSQYFLTYYANITEETIFFQDRSHGTWYGLGLFLVIGHFIIPFILTITQPGKRNPRRLCFAAGWVLVMHAADMYWIIMPQMQVNAVNQKIMEQSAVNFTFHPLSATSLIAFVGILAYIFLQLLSKNALYPIKDVRLMESIHLKN